MGENDTLSEEVVTYRILREHSYCVTEKNPLTYAKKIKFLKNEKFSCLVSAMDTNNHNGVLAKGRAPSLNPLVSNEKAVKKKARVEDIITNIKKGKNMSTNSTDNKANDDNGSSFISMCTIREEHSEIDDLPPLKDSSVFQEAGPVKQDNRPVLLLSPQGEQTLPSKVLVATPTIPANQVGNQPLSQGNNLQRPPQSKVTLNPVPTGSIILNNTSNTLVTQNVPGQPPRKLIVISRPGVTPLYLTHNPNPQGNTLTAVKPDISPKTTQPLIIHYNLPYPNNTCKVVPNNVSQPTGNMNIVRPPNAIRIQTPLSYNLTTNDPAKMSNNEGKVAWLAEKPGKPRANQAKRKRNGRKNDHEKGHDNKATARQRRKHEKTAVKPKQAKPALLTVRVSNRKKNKTVKAMLLDEKSRKPKLSVQPVQIKTESVDHEHSLCSDTTEIGLSTIDDNIADNTSPQETGEKKSLSPEKNGKGTPPHGEGGKGTPSQEKGGTGSPSQEKDGNGSPSQETGWKGTPLCEQGGEGNSSQGENGKEILSPGEDKTETPSAGQVKQSNDTGNLLRDPALLTREERALQRALMRFKEMENQQAKHTVSKAKDEEDKKSLTIENDGAKSKPAGQHGRPKQLKPATPNTRKRTLKNDGDNQESEMDGKKCEIEIQGDEEKTRNVSKRQKGQEIINAEKKKRKMIVVVSDDGDKFNSALKRDLSSGTKVAKHNGAMKLKSPRSAKPLSQEIKSPLRSPKLPANQTKSPSARLEKSADSSTEKQPRVKTYMLIPSYRGFKDFAPVVLDSRTRHNRGDTIKNKPDEMSTKSATKVASSPKKDHPLLVVETVNNKPVKQDIVVKDEQLRDVVTNSLRAQGMLADNFEAMQKSSGDEQNFENREKRHVTVNRNTGETVLHKAARMGYDETVYHSIQQGFDSNAKDNAGWTPLHEACSRGHANVVKVLVKYNADVNSCSNDGIRPIHDAADNGNTDSLRLLLAHGADPFISTYSGRSSYDCAKKKITKDFIKSCIGDLYLTDERNDIADLDYEDRWEFRGSCSAMDKDDGYLSGIFDNFPEINKRSSIEFEWSDAPHLPTFNLPLMKEGVIVGRKNYVKFQDLQERLGKSRNTLIRLLKRTEIRKIPLPEFIKETSVNSYNKLYQPPAGSSRENPVVEVVPLNWNVRYLLKIKTETISI